MHTNSIASLVFTKIQETATSGKYNVYISIQGITDNKYCHIKVNFYDANNRVLGEETIIKSVAANQPYNILTDHFWDKSTIDNAVRMEFYSTDGHVAVYGNGIYKFTKGNVEITIAVTSRVVTLGVKNI